METAAGYNDDYIQRGRVGCLEDVQTVLVHGGILPECPMDYSRLYNQKRSRRSKRKLKWLAVNA